MCKEGDGFMLGRRKGRPGRPKENPMNLPPNLAELRTADLLAQAEQRRLRCMARQANQPAPSRPRLNLLLLLRQLRLS